MTDYAALVREAREVARLASVGSDYPTKYVAWIKRLADAVEELSAALDLEFGGSTCSEPLPPLDLSKIELRPGVPGVYAEVVFDQSPIPREGQRVSCRFVTDERGNIHPVFECERGDSNIGWKEPKS